MIGRRLEQAITDGAPSLAMALSTRLPGFNDRALAQRANVARWVASVAVRRNGSISFTWGQQ